jgi:hypothetical protein
MQNLILSFLLLFIGCGSDNQTEENLDPCIHGTFGSNVPISSYSSEEIKSIGIDNLEKQLTFRHDGTGFYYVPVIKNQFPEFRVEFIYTYKNNRVELTATHLFANGVEPPNDGLNKPEVLLEKRLQFYKLFSSLKQEITCSCTTDNIQTKFANTTFGNELSDDSIFDQNKLSDITSWIRRK